MYEKIPQELKEQKCWVCYTLPDKLPKNPKTGGNAQSNNRSTWSDYNTAVKAKVIIRAKEAGVFFGTLKEKDGTKR